MSLPLLFSTAFVVGLSGAMMPGPVTAVTIDHALKRGVGAAPLIAFGHGITEVVIVVLLVVGLGRMLEFPAVAGVIGIGGGAVLAWMGWGVIRSARSGEVSLSAEQQDGGGHGGVGPVGAGVLSTLANPYWFLWWVTVGAGYVALAQQHGLRGVLLFFGGHILSDLSWLLVLAAAMVGGKRWISDRIYAAVVAILGGFLIVLAGYFFWTGLDWLGPHA